MYDGCLQYLLKGAKAKMHRTSGVVTSFRLHHKEIGDVKYYEERFENGPDLHDRGFERGLSRADIRAYGN